MLAIKTLSIQTNCNKSQVFSWKLIICVKWFLIVNRVLTIAEGCGNPSGIVEIPSAEPSYWFFWCDYFFFLIDLLITIFINNIILNFMDGHVLHLLVQVCQSNNQAIPLTLLCMYICIQSYVVIVDLLHLSEAKHILGNSYPDKIEVKGLLRFL